MTALSDSAPGQIDVRQGRLECEREQKLYNMISTTFNKPDAIANSKIRDEQWVHNVYTSISAWASVPDGIFRSNSWQGKTINIEMWINLFQFILVAKCHQNISTMRSS